MCFIKLNLFSQKRRKFKEFLSITQMSKRLISYICFAGVVPCK